MTPFETERLIVRRWQERDRPRFHLLNSDDRVLEFFTFRRDRAEADAMMDKLNAMQDRDGITFFAVEEKMTGVLLGMTGLARSEAHLPFAPAVEVGWRLFTEAWGKGYATEAASACLDRAFGTLGFEAVVSLCAVENRRSEAVMLRLGFRPDGAFDHPAVDPATHPHLVRHKLYRLARADWLARPPNPAA